MCERNENWQGMNWLRKDKRLAIYMRDGMACVYCGKGIEHGITLTLDHIKPFSKGGSNEATNLITACSLCNSARGNKPIRAYADTQTVKRINKQRVRKLDRKTAKHILSNRPSFKAAVYSVK
jgi:5-methylcytosine-specific restriction endonuclease McrA